MHWKVKKYRPKRSPYRRCEGWPLRGIKPHIGRAFCASSYDHDEVDFASGLLIWQPGARAQSTHCDHKINHANHYSSYCSPHLLSLELPLKNTLHSRVLLFLVTKGTFNCGNSKTVGKPSAESEHAPPNKQNPFDLGVIRVPPCLVIVEYKRWLFAFPWCCCWRWHIFLLGSADTNRVNLPPPAPLTYTS